MSAETRIGATWDALVLATARGVVDAVRYSPQHLALVLACGVSQPEVPPPVARWWADVRVRPGTIELYGVPHALLRRVAAAASRWFGPTASAVVRWSTAVTASTADHATAQLVERRLRARAHPGLLVPHAHAVVVVAVDMRGFSQLTRELHDTQYLTDLIGDYLTDLTRTVERHGGIVFQYTGDGLLAVFLPELAALPAADLLDRLVRETCPALHEAFDALYGRWRADWERTGRTVMRIGLGVGMSFGSATIGFIGPAGKKHIGVIGEPVNTAAYLCSQARAGTALVDYASFARAGAAPPATRVVRLRSKKRHQRIDTVVLPAKGRQAVPRFRPLQPFS